jgi:hypothetical protein
MKSCRAGLLDESLLGLLILTDLGREKFERYGSIQFRVACLVDDTHSSRAELLEDFVLRDRASDHDRVRGFDRTGM